MNDDCSNLDGFLLGDLPAEAASRFAAHLEQCVACSEAVDQQRWIDGLLMSPHVQELESPSETLVDAFRATTASRRRPTRLIVGVIAAAAALAIGAGWTVLNRQASDVTASGAMAEPTGSVVVAPSALRNDVDPLRATFVGGPDVLVVPVASKYPNVTIVRVYRAYPPRYDTQANSENFELDNLYGG